MRDSGLKFDMKVRQIGSSLGVIIPNLVCKSMDIKKGNPIKANLKADKLIITKEENE